jgi:hypothetical protein
VLSFLARTAVAITGRRLTAVYLDRPRLVSVVNGPKKSWSRSLAILDQSPPNAAVRSRVAPITLWEHFIHHEDVRRPSGLERQTLPDLQPVLAWLLHFNGRRFQRGIRAVTNGGTAEVRVDERTTVAGPMAEVVLWMSGREAAHLEFDAPEAEIRQITERLRV